MICVLQRVTSARVTVGERKIAAIDRGLLALVGVVHADDESDASWLAERLCKLRVFADEAGRMNLSVEDVGGSLLLVSQFTLAADTRRGRRPSFTGAAPPEQGARLFAALAARLRQGQVPVATGEFGAAMQVALVNDGPVTLILDSRGASPPGGTVS
jgi:D-tyrosyl-tRNA(Tyr) deacylase